MSAIATHTSHVFENEMHTLSAQFAAVSAQCADQLRLALHAFWTGSTQDIASVEARDQAVGDQEKVLDELVLRMLALRQPVASDLRTLTACFKLITDLRRVSDEAVGIARASTPGAPPAEMHLERLKEMAEGTEEVLAFATRSFADKDERLAQRVFERDATIGGLYRDVVSEITGYASQHGDEAARSVSAMNVARRLERIAGHAANIAEGTRFALHDDNMPR
jgi:phosphate transport system protein